MKKLLMKWFPGYFQVTSVTWVKFEDFPADTKPFTLIDFNEDDPHLHVNLGIEDKRAQVLVAACDKGLNNNSTMVAAMNSMNDTIKHINEYYYCSIMMKDMMMRQSNPMNGLFAAIIRGSQGGGPE